MRSLVLLVVLFFVGCDQVDRATEVKRISPPKFPSPPVLEKVEGRMTVTIDGKTVILELQPDGRWIEKK